MSVREFSRSPWFFMLCCLAVLGSVAWAGNNNNPFNNRSVGGISISVDGVLTLPTVEDRKLFRQELERLSHKPAAELNQAVEMRMISLKGLEAAIAQAKQNATPLPDELRYLAGLQRIQYVLLYPEKNDIVLAGPGEGWKIDDAGNVIGVTSGLPVIHLDDLLVAFHTVENARRGGINCSIDPTAEGLKQFEQVVNKAAGRMQPGVVQALEKAMGPQTISVQGVPPTSRFARVLVASDYRMKRYAMDLDPSPVPGIVSFPQMLKAKKVALDNMLPRWWMACNYEPLAKSPDGLAWEIRGPGVKIMTETDFVKGDQRIRTGKSDPVAQKWADMMTEHYTALSAKDPIFGELRNLMDLCVIAALTEREGLFDKVGLQIPAMKNETSVELESYHIPKQVATQCTVTKSGRDYIITASGGVDIQSWEVIEKSAVDESIQPIRGKAASKEAAAWWWN